MMAIDWEGILGDTIYLQEAYDDLVMDAYYRELEYEEQERRALAKKADQAAEPAEPCQASAVPVPFSVPAKESPASGGAGPASGGSISIDDELPF